MEHESRWISRPVVAKTEFVGLIWFWKIYNISDFKLSDDWKWTVDCETVFQFCAASGSFAPFTKRRSLRTWDYSKGNAVLPRKFRAIPPFYYSQRRHGAQYPPLSSCRGTSARPSNSEFSPITSRRNVRGGAAGCPEIARDHELFRMQLRFASVPIGPVRQWPTLRGRFPSEGRTEGVSLSGHVANWLARRDRTPVSVILASPVYTYLIHILGDRSAAYYHWNRLACHPRPRRRRRFIPDSRDSFPALLGLRRA